MIPRKDEVYMTSLTAIAVVVNAIGEPVQLYIDINVN